MLDELETMSDEQLDRLIKMMTISEIQQRLSESQQRIEESRQDVAATRQRVLESEALIEKMRAETIKAQKEARFYPWILLGTSVLGGVIVLLGQLLFKH